MYKLYKIDGITADLGGFSVNKEHGELITHWDFSSKWKHNIQYQCVINFFASLKYQRFPVVGLR